MAHTQALKATPRDRTTTGALNTMRREGAIPAVVYGRSEPALIIQINAREFTNMLQHSATEHILVDLEIGSEKKLTMVQEVQRDPLTSTILHADFHAISATETLHAQVPVELVGESPGVKSGGLVELIVHEIGVSCLPRDLPLSIKVDISKLEIGQSLHVGDLDFGPEVTPTLDASVVVVLVAEPHVPAEEEVAAVAAAATPGEVEVLREKKPAEGEEGKEGKEGKKGKEG